VARAGTHACDLSRVLAALASQEPTGSPSPSSFAPSVTRHCHVAYGVTRTQGRQTDEHWPLSTPGDRHFVPHNLVGQFQEQLCPHFRRGAVKLRKPLFHPFVVLSQQRTTSSAGRNSMWTPFAQIRARMGDPSISIQDDLSAEIHIHPDSGSPSLDRARTSPVQNARCCGGATSPSLTALRRS
jgi:hypothetical protein